MKQCKNFWRMGLLVLAALLVPQWLGAQTVTSTFVYSEINYPGDQGPVTTICRTREGNDWSTTDQITLDYDGIAFYGGVTLTSQFPVSGELTGISMRCNDASPLTVALTAPDETGGYSSLAEFEHYVQEDGTVLNLMPTESVWVDQNNVRLEIDVNRGYQYPLDSLRIYSISLEFQEVQDDNPLGVTIYMSAEGDSYSVEITEDNMNDVLGDGTISFTPDGNILTLNNASFGGEAGALECSLPNLTIHLYVGPDSSAHADFHN